MRHETDCAWVGINFNSMQAYIFFVTMSSLSPRANYLLFNGQREREREREKEREREGGRDRESFLSVNHKLIRPKEKVSVITHLHWFCWCDYRQQ
jgi:hypothetical protein